MARATDAVANDRRIRPLISLPDVVTVSFNISAKGTLTNQIGVSAERSGVSILPKGSATANVESNSERGNQIMITLKNIYFNKEMPLWTAKDAEDVAKRPAAD